MTAQPQPQLRAQQINEIVRCGKDPAYFLKKYGKIQHMLRGTIPFETYPFQDDCIGAFLRYRLNIVLKSRQLGLSTICAGYAAWLAIFHKDKNILVIATKLKTAINFIKKVKFILQNLPPWLLLPKADITKQEINFSNGSCIVAIPTSPDAGRSEALSLLIVDEAAFIHDFEDIWTGLAPTFSTGGSAIILSTPNGVGGQYYRLWTQAEAGQNDFNPIRLLWDVHPEHDQAWFNKETRSLPKRKVSQEYLCDFVSSGDTFLRPEDLEELRGSIREPLERAGHDRNLWIWQPAVLGRTYVISSDVARGDAADYSAFHVIDVLNREVVAEYMGKIPPEKLADMLDEWGRVYNDALLVPENNTFGYFVNVKLRDSLKYKRLYYRSNKGDPFNYIPIDPTELPGFQTDQKTRVQILTKLEEMVRSRALAVHSRRLYDQLQAFVWNGNKPLAGKDSHDDLIMSLAIGCWLVDGSSNVGEQAIAMSKALLQATTVMRRSVLDMPGGLDEAGPIVNPSIRAANVQSVYRPRDARMASRPHAPRGVVDFGWLLR